MNNHSTGPADDFQDRFSKAQPSEDTKKLDTLIEQRIKIASTETKSDDPVVQIAWLADGIEIWHETKGEMGNSPAKARRYIISSITRYVDALIAAHDRNLLAGIAPMQTEWEEDINGTPNPAGIIRNELRRAIIKAATPGKEK